MVARCSVDGLYTIRQAGRSRVCFPVRQLDYFNGSNLLSRTMASAEWAANINEFDESFWAWGLAGM
jgi:hypothetical protein